MLSNLAMWDGISASICIYTNVGLAISELMHNDASRKMVPLLGSGQKCRYHLKSLCRELSKLAIEGEALRYAEL